MRHLNSHELKVIDKTAKNLAPFFVFGHYDCEDIEQEVRLICCTIIDGYDEEKSDLYTYLFMHARNFLIDMRRKKLSRAVKPCMFDDAGNCVAHTDEKECKKYKSRAKNNKQKRELCSPKTLSDEKVWVVYNIGEEMDRQYIFNVVDAEIPAKLRHDYLVFLEGGDLSYYNKKMVIQAIQDIATRHGLDTWAD